MLNYINDILPILEKITPSNEIPSDKKLLHKYYDKTVQLAERYEETFSDEYPNFLDIQRPREKEIYKKYQKDIYENVLKNFPSKVNDMIESIRQNDDYEIFWSDDEKERKDGLYQYFVDKNIEEWVFKYYTNKFINDPNALVVVLPQKLPSSEREYIEPVPMLIESDDVIQYKKNRFACVLTDEKVDMLVNGKIENKGNVYYFIDNETYTRCEQIEQKGNEFIWNVWGLEQVGDGFTFNPPKHYMKNGMMPCWKIGERLAEFDLNGNEYYVSIVDDAIPHLRSAARIYLDMQIERLHHVHTIEWMVNTKRACTNPRCNNGFVDNAIYSDDGAVSYIKEKCNVCAGGDTSLSSLDTIVIHQPEQSGYDSPAPLTINGAPAGFVPRNIEALRTFSKEYEKEKRAAFATLNAEFLLESPNSESGTSKSYDRQEYYRLLARIASHYQKDMTLLLDTINQVRYGVSRELGQLPDITVPIDTFDLSREEELHKAINESYQYGGDTEIIKGLEKKYAKKKFGKGSPEVKRIELTSRLDPFYYLEEKNKGEFLIMYKSDIQATYDINDPKLLALVNKVQLSLNLYHYIRRAEGEYPDFLDKPFSEQEAIIKAYQEDEFPTMLKDITEYTMKAVNVRPKVDIMQNNQLPSQ